MASFIKTLLKLLLVARGRSIAGTLNHYGNHSQISQSKRRPTNPLDLSSVKKKFLNHLLKYYLRSQMTKLGNTYRLSRLKFNHHYHHPNQHYHHNHRHHDTLVF